MPIHNVKELRKALSDEFDRIRTGESNPIITNAMANLCGKMISSAALEVEYNRLAGKSRDIKFLE